MIVFRTGGFLRFSVDDKEGRTTISATIHRSTVSTPARSRRPGATRTTQRPRPRPSARRNAERRAHLLEQEVTLAYIRELAAFDQPRSR